MSKDGKTRWTEQLKSQNPEVRNSDFLFGGKKQNTERLQTSQPDVYQFAENVTEYAVTSVNELLYQLWGLIFSRWCD